ncbi:conserved Plasmodium protein, unknown function [Plasmodium knowlesi strain H]|uniref:Arabinogalactan protein n=3 Tax=Plasmodium knowlesi TaxID=5850 RepID=A0A5K1VB21_PLAKH|nr:conserved protein, unknown function [Plasmodium knowlesi strain H]OTN64514.1 Uncharacterized protein PKNOH_S130168400 [Plasmodium knowlesi]CAA9988852.1 conserved protein, unknown function [Plasmodium knowlesi strain H]SBO24680.1 conserved Plasmodium protein, unknown function [Plasmodium knowlesi strain H]SBO27961.1 conserved Plasmodium protein, unknown function [Plasmodium knowlesi strain H]VVS78326.1 conserved protein, unknown function [Plasmodium knowlesi strain H]|eukprot:XP_002261198.1 hypothetical protein, conserved in Plasmodium species [Plasmodium knowlesi strain H]
MALNPTLIQGQEFLFPANKGSEFTYLRREDVKMKLYLPDRTIKEDGMIFLTSIRLVFIKSERSRTNANFISVEFPLNLIEKPKFEQPVFGLNYLSGVVKPLVDHPNSLNSPCKWNLVFLNGQCSSFLNYFFKVYEAAKRNRPLGSLSEFNEQFFSSSNAYVDPSDPTFLYINEPNPENLYNTQGMTQNHYISQNNQSGQDVPVYKRPYVSQHSSNSGTNSMQSYSQPNYIGSYDYGSGRAPYGHQPYGTSGPNGSVYGSQSYETPNYQHANMNVNGNANVNSNVNVNGNANPSSNLLSHYNQQGNRNAYPSHENTMSHYNQHSGFVNYNQPDNRNVYEQNNGNSAPQGQRVHPLYNQPNNQQYNPAYNEQLSNMHNQNGGTSTYPSNQQSGERNAGQTNN